MATLENVLAGFRDEAIDPSIKDNRSNLVEFLVQDSLFPPFNADFKNITLGKNVLTNSGCKFQDQGGITIGDRVLIGRKVVLAAVNHALEPNRHRKNYYELITIKNVVWVGSNVTVLSGVKIGVEAFVAGVLLL